MRTGLVVGKFYPPHVGHDHLVRQAAAQVDQLVVVVMTSAAETIALQDRADWLRDEYADAPGIVVTGIVCDAPLDLGDEQVWAAQVACMRAALHQVGVEAVDIVFTGEAYGQELAVRFGARWVLVERPEPWSATSVRTDLHGCWDLLVPSARAGLALRVVVLGAESTGTTTVSRLLADHYRHRWPRTGWVAEYGRELTEAKLLQSPQSPVAELVWDLRDFEAVGAEQSRREDLQARQGSPVLICDTDAQATAIWERRYLAPAHRSDPDYARVQGRRLYLLTDHAGVPWHDDGMREGDLAIRAAMTGWFADVLTARGHSWVLLTGSLDQRLNLALRTVDQLLAAHSRFGEPYSGPGFGRTRR